MNEVPCVGFSQIGKISRRRKYMTAWLFKICIAPERLVILDESSLICQLN